MGVAKRLLLVLLLSNAISAFGNEEALPEEQGNQKSNHGVRQVLGIHKKPDVDPADQREAADQREGFDKMKEQLQKFIEQIEAFKGKYDFPLFNDDPSKPEKEKTPSPENPMPSEMNYPQILGSDAEKEFHNKSATGNKNKADKIPAECENFASLNPDGITFVQPSSVNDLGAVIFGGQACSGVKRRSGEQNNWPSAAADGFARMTPDGVNGKSSQNFAKGSYGGGEDLRPIWLGDSGAVQIHSLSTLPNDSSLAGVSSMGCLVVNQDCMKALNQFLAKRTDLKFRIVTSDGPQSDKAANDACTKAVNKPSLL